MVEARRNTASVRREFPMANDGSGEPVAPPSNAIGWRVLMQRRERGPLQEFKLRGVPLVLDLGAKHHELAFAVGERAGAYYLQPIDEFRTRSALQRGLRSARRSNGVGTRVSPIGRERSPRRGARSRCFDANPLD